MNRDLRNTALLGTLCALLFIPSFGRMPVEREKELRVVLVARDMVEKGHWIAPRYRGELRLKKPPLLYWVVASAFRIARTTESIQAARFPSMLFASALVLAVYAVGARLVGRHRALAGAAAMATTHFFTQHAQFAETDIPLSLFIVLAMFFLYRLAFTRPRMWDWIWLGLFIGLGFLTKGLAALAIPGLMLPILAVARICRSRRVLSPRVLLTAVVAAIVILPWYVAILRGVATDDAARAQIQSELVAISGKVHSEPFYYYLVHLPVGLMPWGLVLPVAVFVAWRLSRINRRLRFVLAWFLTGFVLLTALPTKQYHYSILMLPPASLLIGGLLAPPVSRSIRGLRRFRSIHLAVALVLAVTLLTATAGYLVSGRLASPATIAAGGVGLISSIIAASILARSRQPAVLATAAFLALSIMWGIYCGFLHNRLSGDMVLRQFCMDSRALLAPDARVYASGRHSSAVEFFLHRPVESTVDVGRTWRRARPGDALVLLESLKAPGATLDTHTTPMLTARSRADRFTLLVKPAGDSKP